MLPARQPTAAAGWIITMSSNVQSILSPQQLSSSVEVLRDLGMQFSVMTIYRCTCRRRLVLARSLVRSRAQVSLTPRHSTVRRIVSSPWPGAAKWRSIKDLCRFKKPTLRDFISYPNDHTCAVDRNKVNNKTYMNFVFFIPQCKS